MAKAKVLRIHPKGATRARELEGNGRYLDPLDIYLGHLF